MKKQNSHIESTFKRYEPDMKPLETAKRWIPGENQSYSYINELTFTGDFWECGTGPAISTLSPPYSVNMPYHRGERSCDFKIRGTYGIRSDAEGWKLFMILTEGNPHREEMLLNMIEAYGQKKYEKGQRDARAAVREALGID